MRTLLARFAAVCVVGALAAVLSAYHVSLSPLSLHPRAVQFSVAKADLFVDTPSSLLRDRTIDWELRLPPETALTYALFLQSDWVRQEAAQAAGIPGKEIVASGPFTTFMNPPAFQPRPSPIPSPVKVAPNYRLLVDVAQFEPMVSLYAQAPTTKAAVAIVNSVRALLTRRVAAQEATTQVPLPFRAVVRPLGPPVSGVVDPSGRLQAMAAVFCIILVLGGGLVAALDRRRYGRSSTEVPDRLSDPSTSDDWPNTRRLLPWSIAVFLAMLFLVPIDELSLPAHLPLSSSPDRVLLVVILLLWLSALVGLSGAARPRIRITPAHFAVVGFLGLCCVGIALNGHALTNDQEVIPTLKKLLLLASFVVFFIIVASVLRPSEIPRLIGLMVGLGVIVALGTIIERETRYNVFYSVWQGVLPLQLPVGGIDTLDAIGRLTVVGSTSQPLELAAMLSMVLPFAIVRTVSAPDRRRRVFYLLAAAILFAGAISTSRKTAIVAPVIGTVTLVAYRPRVMLRAIAVSIVPLLLAVHVLVPGQLGSVWNELLPGNVNTVGTTTNRVARYDAVRPDLMTHLLLGRGYLSYDPFKYRVLDNQYLGLLIGVGVIGVLSYLAIFCSFLVIARPTIRGPDPVRADAALAAQAAIVMFVVSNALFDVLSFSHDAYLALLIGAMILVLRQRSPDARPAAGVRRVDPPTSPPVAIRGAAA